MNDSAPPVSARLAHLHRMTRLLLGLSVVCLAMALVVFLAFPGVITGLPVPVAVYALYAAVGARRSAKRTATVLSLVAAHKASHAAARATAR
jgi:hypothetical protein